MNAIKMHGRNENRPMKGRSSMRGAFCGLLVKSFFATVPMAGLAFQCNVQVPAGNVGASRTATVTCSNDGSSSIAAPYVRLEAGDNAYVRFSENDAWTKSVEFLATSDQSPASSLRAGETINVPVFVYTDTEEAQVTLSYTQSSTEAFPWADIGASLKPSYVKDAAWAFALETLKSRLGVTWDSYLGRLRANSDYLAENGRPVRRMDRLLQIEINRALGVDAVLPVLASVTDAARSARGMGLSFTRSYSSAMYGRFTSGILGYGWTDNLSTYAELSADGQTLVFRVPGGGSYSFTKVTGSWQPEDARDKTVLTETSSAYTLTYQNGTVQTFAQSNMRTSTIADNNGNTLRFTWNGTTLKNIVHADGQSLTFAYSGGLLSSVTDDYGRKTSYTYSDLLLTKVTTSDGLVTSYEYHPADGTVAARALSRIVYPDGTTREFTYDASSGLVSAVSANGGNETKTISREDGVVTLTGPDGAVTTVKTGVAGEVLETVDALGGVSTKGYTEDGLLKSVISASGLTGSISYDTLGRVNKSVSAAGTETAFAYEETFGNLKTVTDAKNHAVTYGYDPKGHGNSVTFADGSASTLEYNDRGDVVKSTNRRGETITYSYYDNGLLKEKKWSNGRTFTYSYDECGNVKMASDSETGTVTMQYDHADRLKRIEYPTGRGFTFSYDSCGRLETRTSLDGAVEKFAYDASGRLASVTDGSGNAYLQNTYDATSGRLSKQVNGNGTSVSYLYDKLGRVVSIEHCGADGKIVEALQYCYDADGRCIRAASLLGEERYTYDKDGQLTAVEYPDGKDESFTYDAVGNRTKSGGSQSSATVTYNVNDLNQYTSISGGAQSSATSIRYDEDGNMTLLTDANGTTTYTYDTLNRLVSVKNETTGLDWSCTYDVFGNRVSVTHNGVTTERTYLQGSLPSVAAEYVNGELKERHIVVGAVRIADVAATPSSSRYYHADLIGSTRLVTDGTGTIVDHRSYKAFGEPRTTGGSQSSATATVGYVGTLGVETDPTGLLFMRNRYYSPVLGRFIQVDPSGILGRDVNFYRYAYNSPISNVDVEGRAFLGLSGGTWAAIGITALGVVTGGIFISAGIAGIGAILTSTSVALGTGSVAGVGGGILAGLGMIAQGVLLAGLPIETDIMLYLNNNGFGSEDYGYEIIGDSFGFDYTTSVNVPSGSGDGSVTPIVPEGFDLGALKNQDHWLWVAAGKDGSSATYSLDADIEIDLERERGPLWLKGELYMLADNPEIVDNVWRVWSDGRWRSTYIQNCRDGGSYVWPFSEYSDPLESEPHDSVVVATFDQSIIPNFSGKLLGNGHVLSTLPTSTTDKRAVLFRSPKGATFKDVTFAGRTYINNVSDSIFTNVVFTEESGIKTASNCEFYDVVFTGNATIHSINGCKFKNVRFDKRDAVNGISGCEFQNVKFANGGVVGDNNKFENVEFECYGDFVWNDAKGCTFISCELRNSCVPFVKMAESCSFNGLSFVVSSDDYSKGSFGSIVGDAKGCNFNNCNVTSAYVNLSACDKIGTLVGSAENCTFVSCSAVGTIVGKDNVGGLVGKATGCSFSDCLFKVDITGNSNVGGMVGWSENDEFFGSTAQGNVTGTGDGEVGGFVGISKGSKFANCQASGMVKGNANVGGFVGNLSKGAIISKCSASGKIVPSGSTLSSLGGFVGTMGASEVSDCKATGAIAQGGAGTIGGFVGACAGDNKNPSATSIVRCSASGAVVGGTNIGGFAGSLLYCTVSDCCASGAVTAMGQTESTGGYSTTSANVGGFAAVASTKTGGVTLRHCYASGNVTTIASDAMNNVVATSGGFTPFSIPAEYLAYITADQLQSMLEPSDACYWNKGTTRQNYSGTGTGLTAAQAKSQSSYSGWDFGSTWKMGSNGPELQNVGATISTTAMKAAMLARSIKTASDERPSSGSANDADGRLEEKADQDSVAISTNDSIQGPAMVTSAKLRASVNAASSVPRLYCYERYVVVKGVAYSFELSADGDATISVSGLPSGFSFADGAISGSASAVSEATITITASGSAGSTPKSVSFVVIDPPAWWNTEEELVSITVNDIDGVIETRTLVVGQPYGYLPELADWGGYTFGGWYTGPNGTGRRVTAESLVEADDSGIYAYWTTVPVVTYAVTYKPGVNGTGAQQTATKTQDVTLSLASAIFTRTGYTQTGWATSDGGAKVYDLGASYAANADITLYPFWTAISQSDPEPDPEPLPITGLRVSGPELIDLYDEAGGRYTATVTSQDGTTMEVEPEWSVSGDGVDAAQMTRDGELGFSYYTIYECTTVTVTAVYGGLASSTQTVIYGPGYVVIDKMDVQQNAVWPGCTFVVTPKSVRWWRHGVLEEPTSDLSDVVFSWDLRCPGDEYRFGDGTSFTVPSDALSTNGTCMVGIYAWSGRERHYYIGYGQRRSMKFYDARPQMVTVTFDANGGEVSFDTMQCVPGKPYGYGFFPDLIRKGYYGYWYTEREGGAAVNGESSVPTANTTLYAHWSPQYYKLTFDANGGEGEMYDQYLYYDTPAAISACAFRKEGSSFVGWALSPDGAVVYEDQQEVVNLRDSWDSITLYAVWQQDDYVTITFDANGGTGGWSSNMVFGAAITAPEVTYEGYEFKGWDPVPAATVPASNVTYTARWTRSAGPGEEDPPIGGDELVKQTITIPRAGWNLVSINVLPDDPSPEAVFAEVADSIQSVVSGTRRWTPQTGGRLAALQIGVGYWVKTTRDNVVWTISGKPDVGVEIRVNQGWNLIGYPLLDAGSPEAVLQSASSSGIVSSVISGTRRWTPQSGGRLTEMTPGVGYWLKATKAGTIKFDR